MKMRISNPAGIHHPSGYSHVGIVEGPAKIVYISGQVARNEAGQTVGKGNLEEQTKQVYRNLSNILSTMGASFKNVVKQNIYTTRMDQISAIRKVRDEFITSDTPPCSTLVGVTALADPDFLIEVEAVAVLD